MTLDNAPGNEQAESYAPTVVLGQLHEALKNRFQLFIGNAFPSVADATDNVVSNVVEAYDDGALSGGELQCIAQKVAEHLKDPRGIKRNRWQPWRNFRPQRDPAARGCG